MEKSIFRNRTHPPFRFSFPSSAIFGLVLLSLLLTHADRSTYRSLPPRPFPTRSCPNSPRTHSTENQSWTEPLSSPITFAHDIGEAKNPANCYCTFHGVDGISHLPDRDIAFTNSLVFSSDPLRASPDTPASVSRIACDRGTFPE